jgi:hypothetical protein
VRWVQGRDAVAGVAVGAEPDQVAGRGVLVLGEDAIGAGDVATGQLLERVVAIEAAAALAQLDDPRPDRLGWGVDRYGSSRRHPGTRDQLVAGHRSRDLGGASPPPIGHPSQERRGHDGPRDLQKPLRRLANHLRSVTHSGDLVSRSTRLCIMCHDPIDALDSRSYQGRRSPLTSPRCPAGRTDMPHLRRRLHSFVLGTTVRTSCSSAAARPPGDRGRRYGRGRVVPSVERDRTRRTRRLGRQDRR